MIAFILLASFAGNLAISQKWELLLIGAEQLALQNQHVEAEKQYAKALEEAARFGQKELPVAVVLDHNAFHHQQLGQLKEASWMYERAFDIFVRKAPESRALTQVAIGLSSVYLESGEISRAELLLKRFLARDTGYLPEERAMLLANLGSALTAQGDIKGGEFRFDEVLTILQKDGTELQLMVKTLNNLATIYCITGRISNALDSQSLIGLIKDPPPDLAIKTLSTAAGISNVDRKWEESQKLYGQASALCEETYGPDHYLLAQILQGYSQALLHLNHKREAKRAKKRADAILDKFRRENDLGLTIDVRILTNPQTKSGSLSLQ
jgi:tetratricopeptide (TPR) repeat protein